MQSHDVISVNLENPRHVIDISQPQMVRKDVMVSGGNGNNYAQRPNFIPPNLNVINDASLGADLLMNPKKRIDTMSVASSEDDHRGGGHYYDSGSGSGSGSGSSSVSGSSSASGSSADTASDVSESESGDSEKGYFQRQVMSEEDILNKKKELLYQFDRLERKGVRLPRKFNLASDLNEMQAELDKIVREKQVDASVKFQRRILVTAATGLEMLNSRFDPVGARLDGWSESINDGIDEYDEVFEELYDKYKGKAKIAPELKLLMMLGGSAFMFHLTNSMFKSSAMPGLDQVLKQNPDLAKQFASATANSMQQSGADPMGLGKMFTGMFKPPPQQAPPMPSNPMGQPMGGSQAPQNRPRPTMKGPSLDNILADLDQGDRLETMSTLTESEISELPDDGSISGLLINKSKKGRRTLNF